MSNTKKNNSTAGQKIIQLLHSAESERSDLLAKLLLAITNLSKKIDELLLSKTPVRRTRKTTSKSKTTTTTTSKKSTNEKKFPTNTFNWFKQEYAENKDDLEKKFLTSIDKNELSKVLDEFNKNPKNQRKSDFMKKKAEGAEIWKHFIKTNNSLYEIIKSHYNTLKNEFNKNSLTTVVPDTTK